MSQFDAFFSYNSNDGPLVKQIANDLIKAGIKVWFDEHNLPPASNWQKAIEKDIEDSMSVIVFIGPSGIGEWQETEVDAVLSLNVERKIPVIPVILPGVIEPKLPIFLKRFNCVDLRRLNLDKLIEAITGRKPSETDSQIGGEFYLELMRPTGINRLIKIYTLPNPDRSKLLNLNWKTFGLGIENLSDQIRNYGDEFHTDVNACFGINDAGLVIATFLNYTVLHRVKIGYIKCKRSYEKTIIRRDCLFPKLPPKPAILLVDFEVKSSTSIKMIVEEICKKYNEPEIYFGVFGALTEKTDLVIRDFEDLKPADNLKKLDIKDYFIACTMHLPGIDPPLGLR